MAASGGRSVGSARPVEAPAGSAAPHPIAPFTYRTSAMGGRLEIHLAGIDDPARAARDSARVARRVLAWASRLSRHDPGSELSRLNATAVPTVRVRPTLAAALAAGRDAGVDTGGLVDVTLLDERLRAEHPSASLVGLARAADGGVPHPRTWSLRPDRRGATVARTDAFRFDLDGIGKGWLADRALRLLDAWPSAIVDADGDLAVKAAPGQTWEIAVDDPRPEHDGALAALLTLHNSSGSGPRRWGVATSGISIHRWNVGGRTSHHLIDPRMGQPATTDVLQTTVVAGSAIRAETLAKACVIAGLADGFALLEGAGVAGAIAVLTDGSCVALPRTRSLLGE